MKTITSFLFLAFCLAQTASAQNKRELTQIITYKVNLRFDDGAAGTAFSDPYFVYTQLSQNWYQNKLHPAQYQPFVCTLHEAVMRGKITVYDPMEEMDGYKPVFRKLPPGELARMGNDTIYKTLQRPYPPYDDYDTSIVILFNPTDITQIEFMEKWTWNPKTMAFKKRIIAYALWCRRNDLYTGEYRGVNRMYWVKCR